MNVIAVASQNSGPLQSQTIITDGEWHLIGFVWDGSRRTLYVDNIAVQIEIDIVDMLGEFGPADDSVLI